MIPPMSPTSVFEQSHSESSQSSSMETQNNSNNNHESSTPPRNPRLEEIYQLARQYAERQHAEKALQRNNKKPRKSITKRSKRQESNIRSAEICRAAKSVYTKRLEECIGQTEEACLAITSEKYDTIKQMIELKKKIQEVEEKQRRKEQEKIGLWMSKCCDESDGIDNTDDGFFRVSNDDDDMKWQFQNPTMSYVSEWEEGVEMVISEEEEQVGVTSRCDREDTSGLTAEDKQMFAVDTGFTKGAVGSPVSVFGAVQQLADEDSLRTRVRI